MMGEVEDRRLVPEAVRGWKRARVVVEHGTVMFEPLSAEGLYGVEEEARCTPLTYQWRTPYTAWMGTDGTVHGQVPHEVPAPDCTCGFHALREPPDFAPVEQADLEVDLTGTVVVHKRGYRAQRQTVVSVAFPKWCFDCLDDVPAVGLAVNGRGWLLPRCDEHLEGLAGWSLADVASELGTEVRWSDRPAPLVPSFHSYHGVGRAARFTHVHWHAGGPVTPPPAPTIQEVKAVTEVVRRVADVMKNLGVTAKELADQFQARPGRDQSVRRRDGETALEWKRRRDAARQERLEQLAGPRRPGRRGR